MNRPAEKLLDLYLSGAAILERGYRTLPLDWFVDANDPDGHVRSWSECFPGVPQNPIIFLEDSAEWLATLFPNRTYRVQGLKIRDGKTPLGGQAARCRSEPAASIWMHLLFLNSWSSHWGQP